MSREDDSLEDAIKAGVDGALLDVHTQLRGTVLSYNEVTHTCTVKLATRVALSDDAGGIVYQSLPDLTDVPVAWPSAGGFMLHWPLPAGSSVFITFDEQSSQQWEKNGEVCSPRWIERFGLGSALAHPYSRTPIATSGANMPCPTAFAFGNAAASRALTRDDKFRDLYDALIDWVKTGVAPSGGGTVTYATPAPSNATACAKLKAE